MNSTPELAIIIPAHNSHHTLAGCLQAIERQSYRPHEVIVVDSGPSGESERLVRRDFPWVNFERTGRRLYPHAARNRGAELSSASVLVFTDPDVYPREDWLAQLALAYQRTGGIVVGSVDCHGRRWIDLGTHLAKFDMWLPGSPPAFRAIAPTLNLLCPRTIFDDLGGFPGELMIGDTLFSWKANSRGYTIAFEPEAVVDHHHLSSWGQLLRERYSRGAEFGLARVKRSGWTRGRVLFHLLLTVLPFRWIGLVGRTLQHARRAGMLGAGLSTSPIIITAHAAWLAGESRGLISALGRTGGRGER